MVEIDVPNQLKLSDLDRFNVLLGKNGSGKSTILRNIDAHLMNGNACVRYVTPERGGQLTYDGSIETNRANNPGWMSKVRRNNRYEQFRQSSVAEFRNLETLVLRQIERDPEVRASDFNFDSVVESMNILLDRVKLRRANTSGFLIKRSDSDEDAKATDLSSGESELISLAVEVLLFAYLCKQEHYANQDNWLLLDEPDVHLHPDLQHRLMKLLVSELKGGNGRVLVATHSTSILASLIDLTQEVRIGFKNFESVELAFRSTSNELRSVLPMFGAHPLSNVFNDKPPLIVEGEDDERIWQTAIRSSNGNIRLFPCVAGDKQSMSQYETLANEVVGSVYDEAKVFSVRDRDDAPYEIEDVGVVRRARLNCRAAENLILTDDVLKVLGTDWERLRAKIETWIDSDLDHPKRDAAIKFRDGGYDRRNADLKDLRNQLVHLSGSAKGWEVAVGKAIAKLAETERNGDHSLRDYLGEKLIGMIGTE